MDDDIVIEVRGGCLIGVYCNGREQRFILLDWDNLSELPKTERMGSLVPGHPFGQMREDTRSVYDRTVFE